MANSSALDSCVKQSYRKKIVRAAVRVRAVHRTRHHLSVPALSSDLISADKALRAPRTAAAIRPENLTASPENYQPSVDIARVRRMASEPSRWKDMRLRHRHQKDRRMAPCSGQSKFGAAGNLSAMAIPMTLRYASIETGGGWCVRCRSTRKRHQRGKRRIFQSRPS
jgi:hypothetical protein